MAQSVRAKNGVLPVPVAATKRSSKSEVSGRQPPKANAPRLRLIIRRLAPGLTEEEFWTALGEEWKAGSAKVDWAAYKAGKVSREYVSSLSLGRPHAKFQPAHPNHRSHQEHT